MINVLTVFYSILVIMLRNISVLAAFVLYGCEPKNTTKPTTEVKLVTGSTKNTII